MSHVVTFGEILLRLTTPGHERFAQSTEFEINFGGAEANVAVAIAQLGGSASFVTKVPDHELGQRAIDELQRHGVYTPKVVRGGERLGVFFLEQGASQRASKVIYDRAHSSIAEAELKDFDWPAILDGARWLHWSGITPALSAACAQIVAEASATARHLGVTVSFDMNYRAKLWSPARASQVLTPLMKNVDVCICGLAEASAVFGVDAADAGYVAAELAHQFDFKTVCIPQRKAVSASTTTFGATLFTNGECYVSQRHEITIVDRVGSGDAATGALIFSLIREDNPQSAIDFAVAAGALAHTIRGDFPIFTLAEVEALAGGLDGGRVQR